MRRFTFGQSLKFRPSPFRLFAAAAAFALGLSLAGHEARRGGPQCVPLVVAVETQSEKGVRDHSEYETCAEAASHVEDRYYNYNYGFSVDLPSGMVGGTSPPPAPQHGFGVDLDNPKSADWGDGDWPKSYLYVDGSYNSSFLESLDAAAERALRFLAEDGCVVNEVKRTRTRLAGLRAERVVALYKKRGEVMVMVKDEIVALRKGDDGEVEVVYTIALDTPLPNYARDRPVLDGMQKTFCLQPIP